MILDLAEMIKIFRDKDARRHYIYDHNAFDEDRCQSMYGYHVVTWYYRYINGQVRVEKSS